MKSVYTLLASFVLFGCDAANTAADNIARTQAKSTVNQVVAERLPGVNVAPVTDCVIEAASAGEIIQLAGDSVSGVSSSTVSLVLDIAQRPDATRCIAQNSTKLLG